MEKKIYLIAGLGNPGDKYKNTRHNVGFCFIEEMAEKFNISLSKSKFNAETGKGKIEGSDVVLVKPLSYMNLSGDPVQKIVHFYDIDVENVIIVHDDLDLENGRIKLKKGGGHGGHNGIRSVISTIGREFNRLRIGIGRPDNGNDVTGFVLGKFRKSDSKLLDEIMSISEDALLTILNEGITPAMNRFNRT